MISIKKVFEPEHQYLEDEVEEDILYDEDTCGDLDEAGLSDYLDEASEWEDNDIHAEYNLLVYKYANLLSNYLSLRREHQELLKRDSETLEELLELKERYRRNAVKFSHSPLS